MYICTTLDIIVPQMIDCHTPVRSRIHLWRFLIASMLFLYSSLKDVAGFIFILSYPKTKI